jgi:hypothetical protein
MFGEEGNQVVHTVVNPVVGREIGFNLPPLILAQNMMVTEDSCHTVGKSSMLPSAPPPLMRPATH